MYKVDVYLRVRRAVMVEGKSIREVSREFGLHRDTVRKMLAYSVPPGYRRQTPPKRPKLEPYTGVIDRILEDDLRRPRKQRHTAKRIFERLQGEYGFDGGYTTVKDYVRENRRQTREMFVPLSHPPGHAQCDFGEALVVIGGVEQKAHCFVIDSPFSRWEREHSRQLRDPRTSRRRLYTIDSIQNPQARGVRVRSLDENEASRSRYLDADPEANVSRVC